MYAYNNWWKTQNQYFEWTLMHAICEIHFKNKVALLLMYSYVLLTRQLSLSLENLRFCPEVWTINFWKSLEKIIDRFRLKNHTQFPLPKKSAWGHCYTYLVPDKFTISMNWGVLQILPCYNDCNKLLKCLEPFNYIRFLIITPLIFYIWKYPQLPDDPY